MLHLFLWASQGGHDSYRLTSAFLTCRNSLGSAALFSGNNPQDPWCVSSELSASRALSIIALLRVMGSVQGELAVMPILALLTIALDLSDDCNTVAAFYATSLAQILGGSYQPPSLAYLARHWFESSSRFLNVNPFAVGITHTSSVDELRQAARILFDAGIARLSDEETIILAEQWQHDCKTLAT